MGRKINRIEWPRSLLAALLLLVSAPLGAQLPVAVLPFELRDLTLDPSLVPEAERTAMLRPLLKDYLERHHRYVVVENPGSAGEHAAMGAGYLFDRPELVARIGREAGVRWIVSGRLHKASYLFVYLKAQLIDAESATVRAHFVVEIKGADKKLTPRGVERLGGQINQAIQAIL